MLKTERFELGSFRVRNDDSKEASETREYRWTQPGSSRDPSVIQSSGIHTWSVLGN